MKKQFLLLCTSALVVLSACNKAGERGETGPQGPQGPQGLPGQDLVAKTLFSFDTTESGVKAAKITGATFKNSAKTATSVVTDLKKMVGASGATQLKTDGVELTGDKTLTLSIKELSTTVADDAIGIIVPFSGEGIQAGSTITISILGKEVTDNATASKTITGIGFATKAITDLAVEDVEGFNSIVVSTDKHIPLTSVIVPVSKKDIKQLFFQIAAEEANKKLFEVGKAQVDIAISVKNGQHIDTKHIILKGVAAS